VPSLAHVQCVVADEADKIFDPLSKYATSAMVRYRIQKLRPGITFLQHLSAAQGAGRFQFACVSATLNSRLKSEFVRYCKEWWSSPLLLSSAGPMALPARLKHRCARCSGAPAAGAPAVGLSRAERADGPRAGTW
jgi:hypothetical protein